MQDLQTCYNMWKERKNGHTENVKLKSFVAHCQCLCKLQIEFMNQRQAHCLVRVGHPIAFFTTGIIRTTAHNTDTLSYSHPTVYLCIEMLYSFIIQCSYFIQCLVSYMHIWFLPKTICSAYNRNNEHTLKSAHTLIVLLNIWYLHLEGLITCTASNAYVLNLRKLVNHVTNFSRLNILARCCVYPFWLQHSFNLYFYSHVRKQYVNSTFRKRVTNCLETVSHLREIEQYEGLHVFSVNC